MKKQLALLSLLFAPLLAPSAVQAQSLEAKCQAGVKYYISDLETLGKEYDKTFKALEQGVPFLEATLELTAIHNGVSSRNDIYHMFCPDYFKKGRTPELEVKREYVGRKADYYAVLEKKYNRGN